MKLLICTQKVDANDSVLGFMHGWIAEFAKYCEHVTVICLEKGSHHFPSNVNVLSLGKEKRRSRAQYVRRFFFYIWRERNNYDAVFVHMNQEYVLLGGFLWRLWRKKIGLWYAHGATSFSLKAAERLSDIIFTSTPEGFRLASKKVRVIGQGIDTEKLKMTRDKRADVVYRIISIGRISPSKDYKTLIDAAAYLNSQGEKLKVRIVGGVGTPEQKTYLESLLQNVREKELEHVIEFVGPVSNTAIPEQLRWADLFVNMGQTGSLDKAVLEAMAAELPVLTCNEAFEGVLKDYRELLIYPKRDARALAKRITGIMRLEEGKRRALTADLRSLIERDHSKTRFIARIADELAENKASIVAKQYNAIVKEKYAGKYEYHRWFATPLLRAGYDMTKTAIERHALGSMFMSFNSYLELGPGAGTWTKLFLSKRPAARFDLVDVSSEMLALSREALASSKQVSFFESDFMQFDAKGHRYDFFFSSRVIEYIPNKEGLFAKIASLLKPEGAGFIITKTPKYFRSTLLGRRISSLHRGQIHPRVAEQMLRNVGFKTEFYPVTMYIPLMRSALLNRLCYRLLGSYRLNPLSMFFSESYCIFFSRDDN